MIIAARASLLASQRVEDITQYMSRTQNFNMKNLTEKLSKLLNTTDSKHLTGYERTYVLFLFLFLFPTVSLFDVMIYDKYAEVRLLSAHLGPFNDTFRPVIFFFFEYSHPSNISLFINLYTFDPSSLFTSSLVLFFSSSWHLTSLVYRSCRRLCWHCC